MSLRALNNSAMRTFIKRVSHKKQNRKLFCQPERETCSTQRRLTADWKRVCVLRVQEIKRWQAAAWVTNHWPQSDKGQWEVSIEITVVIGVASPVMWKFLFYLPSTLHPPPHHHKGTPTRNTWERGSWYGRSDPNRREGREMSFEILL